MQPEEEKPAGQPGGGADPGNLDQPQPVRKSRLKPVLWTLFGFFATLAAAAGGLLMYFLGPAEMPGRELVVLIRQGETMPAVAHELEELGLIRNAQAFMVLVKVRGHMGGARAGEFLISSGWAPQEILRVITSTGGIQHRVSVREGLPWWAAQKLFEAEGLSNRAEFEAAMTNASLLEKYGVPAGTAEGYLFPQTYQLPRPQGDGGQAAVEAMLKEFAKQVKKLWPDAPPTPDELKRVVILASLVEKETGTPEERPRIAGVFANRLKIGMRLQCDPTTIYGLGPDFDGDLKRSHLEDASNRYNTYAHAGLPPGPICSPGLESLKAALNPEAHDFLYFVAKGDGSHEFSSDLAAHNRAVNAFQRHRDKDSYRSAPAPKDATKQGKKPGQQPAPKSAQKPDQKPGPKPGAKSQQRG